MRQFNEVVEEAIPAVASYLQEDVTAFDDSWSQDEALADLLERIAREENAVKSEQRRQHAYSARILPFANAAAWRPIWTLFAASILLFVALGILVYRLGLLQGARTPSIATRMGESAPGALEQRLSDAERQYEAARIQLNERDGVIASLRHRLKRQADEMSHFKLEQQRLGIDLRDAELSKQSLVQERSELVQKSDAAQAKMQGLQEKLAALEKQAWGENARALALQNQVRDLTELLEARNKAIDQQEELLAHDRDIRELMGARDLYLAEVYDVERNGQTRKAFGRVFYTKGKSLIFYAYDLDQETGIKNASTFQAWGMHGTDRKQALSLGIFYEDNASKKRWVLKTSDPKLLDQVDAVFVTVEPNGGSHSPSTKPLMFAYLRVGANHP